MKENHDNAKQSCVLGQLVYIHSFVTLGTLGCLQIFNQREIQNNSGVLS